MSAKDIIQAFPTPASGGILSTIDKEACEKAVAKILDGGKKTIHELVDLIVAPGTGNDVQARHATRRDPDRHRNQSPERQPPCLRKEEFDYWKTEAGR